MAYGAGVAACIRRRWVLGHRTPDDATRAYQPALRSDARGAFNLACVPAADAETLGGMFGARPVPPTRSAARTGRRRMASVPLLWLLGNCRRVDVDLE